MYPPAYNRLHNFQRDANNGLESPAPSKVDAELNGVQTTLEQVRTFVRGITSADGRLRNVATAIAQSLVGTWAGTSDGTTTVTTTIPWQASMSVNSVLLLLTNTVQRPAAISSVQDDGSGYLELTLASAPANGTAITVWAFEPGSGLLTRLASTALGDGASLIGVQDALGLLAATDVESALTEIAQTLDNLTTDLGDLSDYLKADGSVALTATWNIDGQKITGAADGVDDTDYVTLGQIAGYIDAWSDLSRYYVRRDGSAAFTGTVNFGSQRGENLADADLTKPLDAVNVRTLQRTVSTTGAAPVGVVLSYIGTAPPSGWLFCDGAAYLGTDYPSLYALLGSDYREGLAQGCRVASFPALVSGNLTGGVISSLPALNEAGVGYTGIPQIRVLNTDGGAAVTTQPTFNVTVSTATLDGATVTGGVLSITLNTGGAGIRAGAIIIIDSVLAATPTISALTSLPAGYFRTPDLRGRAVVGAGTESKTPGVIDPPDLTKGDDYNATPRTLGDYGGEEKHQLTVDELAIHRHTHVVGGDSPGGGSADGGTSSTVNGDYAGGDEAHNTMPPFHVLNYIIKAT